MGRLYSQSLVCAVEFGHFEFTTAPNLTTALSKGREPALSSAMGYGEATGKGLFSSVSISESLTHRFAAPPLPQAGEGCHPLLFRGQIKCPNSSRRACALRQPGVRPLGKKTELDIPWLYVILTLSLIPRGVSVALPINSKLIVSLCPSKLNCPQS